MLSHPAAEIDFSYDSASDAAGLPARVAIFGGDAGGRAQIAADLGGAGFRSIDGGSLAALIEGPIALLGDVVVVDCSASGPRGLDGVMLAGLARLDMRVARTGAKLIVATNLAGLDDVFAVMDQSKPQILVSPSRAERVIAVGRVMGEAGAARLREMGEEDRIALLRLSQQVEAIAHSLDRLSHTAPQAEGVGVLGEFKRDYHPHDRAHGFGEARGKTALPDPRMVRQIIANRQARAQFFDPALFGVPAWDMLLDLTAAHGEGAQVSVTSLCIAAGVPTTTALRWLTQMVESGIFIRVADPADRRRAFIALSDKAIAAMAGYFAQLRAPVELAA
ncbi:MAG: MarR family transcriptional regulator [Alphaproteobacteria bacterium HGW-Alphaproteobacteria-14]|nr:MAG: MarR family transcriptional regulator [Alphaproteobacteria bacterium HGW-Alphaproteobacteria-14]